RAAKQVDRGRHVATLERLLTRGGEMVARSMCELQLLLTDGPELRPVLKRLLEVIADDLGMLGDSASSGILDPGGKVLVKLSPQGLRSRPVGRLLDEDVTEAKAGAGLGRGSGSDELLALQGVQVTRAEGAGALGQQIER